MKPILDLARDLRAGAVTSRKLVEEALERIEDPVGEGSRTFITVWKSRARATADHIDKFQLWRDSDAVLCGIPISVKDVFDIAGEITRAGSIAREDEPAAAADAAAVTALRRAGAILIGRTTMSEFAFSGIGLNRHFGTPLNPWDRATQRIAGGSSSGSAVSVSDGMAAAALASDTGGSIRAPAALCGLTGFKPTAGRVSLKGVFPRSYSLDTAGPMGRSVLCCTALDKALSVAARLDLDAGPARAPLRLGVVTGEPLERLSPAVSEAFVSALRTLSQAGIPIIDFAMPEIARIRAVTGGGGISPPEAYSIHKRLVEESPDLLDPIFLARLLKGRDVRASDYIEALRARKDIQKSARETTRPFDAILMPTCPVDAPPIADVQTPAAFEAVSSLILRNCNLANFLDRPAITLPIHRPGDAPVGLMLVGAHDRDADLLAVAQSVEHILASDRL